MGYYCDTCGEFMYPGDGCGNCGDTGYYTELTPDEQIEEDWYAHGDYLGDLEREEG